MDDRDETATLVVDGEERQADPAARRARHRQRTLKGAAILPGPDLSAVTCTVRDMHEDGALLTFDAQAHIPATFLLYVRVDGIAYEAALRWRKADRAGVSFSGRRPKPKWHYG